MTAWYSKSWWADMTGSRSYRRRAAKKFLPGSRSVSFLVVAAIVLLVTGVIKVRFGDASVTISLNTDLVKGTEIAAAPAVARLVDVFGPLVIVTTRDVAKGAMLEAFARSVDPSLQGSVEIGRAHV